MQCAIDWISLVGLGVFVPGNDFELSSLDVCK